MITSAAGAWKLDAHAQAAPALHWVLHRPLVGLGIAIAACIWSGSSFWRVLCPMYGCVDETHSVLRPDAGHLHLEHNRAAVQGRWTGGPFLPREQAAWPQAHHRQQNGALLARQHPLQQLVEPPGPGVQAPWQRRPPPLPASPASIHHVAQLCGSMIAQAHTITLSSRYTTQSMITIPDGRPPIHASLCSFFEGHLSRSLHARVRDCDRTEQIYGENQRDYQQSAVQTQTGVESGVGT